MGANFLQPFFTTAFTFTAISTTTTTSTFSLPLADAYSFYLKVTTAGTTLDVAYQTSWDKGTTFVPIPLVHTRVVTNTVTDVLNVHCGLGFGELASDSGIMLNAGVQNSATYKNAVFDPQYMNAILTPSGTYTGLVLVACLPRTLF